MGYQHKLDAGSKTPEDNLGGSEGPNQYRDGKEGTGKTGKSIAVDDECKVNHGRPLKTGGKVRTADPSSHHHIKGRKHKGRVKY